MLRMLRSRKFIIVLGVLSVQIILLINFINFKSRQTPNDKIENLLRIRSPTSESVQQNAVIQLIRRLIHERVDEFEVVVNTQLLKDDHKDKFILESVGNKVRITGTSGVSAANGFNYYLKYFANCHISWSGDQLNLPTPLPVIKDAIHMTIQDKFRYYQNVCTLSYSMVWWDFKRWEREIDWMAMRGINFPLAFNGQELIWRRVFVKFGFTESEVNDYFTGPAFLAWNRMGNIQSWSGPLTENWHKYQSILQTQILKRMRDFGMLPILPAFAGHVPRSITRVFPNAKVTKLSNWSSFEDKFCCTTFLEPDDELFVTIGSAFIEEYKNTYGTDHFYNTDLFNELTPRTKDVKYLSDCGKAVYQSLAKSDPQSIWVMQGWLFYYESNYWQKEQTKALITSVPKGKLLILDLMSDIAPVFQLFEGYYGQPFIWCMLHNFGGNIGLIGSLNRINSEVFNDRKNYSSMVGIGLTPEGIEQNDIIYDYMMETTWYTSPVDLDKWVEDYTHRRYGLIDEHLLKAWHLLQNSVYTNTKIKNFGRYVIVRRPKLDGKSPLWYTPSDVYKAFQLFIKASAKSQLKVSQTFNYDLVDITRQSLQLLFDDIYNRLINAFLDSNRSDFNIFSKLMLNILEDMNSILSTNKHFLLANWIESAKSLANSKEEKRFNEYQARNQITIWGPKANILDYANKQWSGMVSDYYKPRWQLFIDYLNKSMTRKIPFNQNDYNKQVFEKVELKFVNQNQTFITEPKGDSISIANIIFENYKKFITQ